MFCIDNIIPRCWTINNLEVGKFYELADTYTVDFPQHKFTKRSSKAANTKEIWLKKIKMIKLMDWRKFEAFRFSYKKPASCEKNEEVPACF